MSDKTVTINIVSHWNSDKVLFSADVDASIGERYRLRAALEMGVKRGASLSDADLRGADLSWAYLSGADLGDDLKLLGDRPYFQLGPIGSESRTFEAFITNQGLRLQTGCFFGTRDEFVERLNQTHGDNIHAYEYTAALVLIDAHVERWTPEYESKEDAA